MANYTREISHMMDRMLTKLLKQDKKGFYSSELYLKLSLLDFMVIKQVGEHEEINVNMLINLLELDRNSIDVSIKNLVSEKILCKTLGTADKRERIIKLTEAGNMLYTSLIKAQRDEIEFVLNDITINEEKSILKFLSKYVQRHTDKYEIKS